MRTNYTGVLAAIAILSFALPSFANPPTSLALQDENSTRSIPFYYNPGSTPYIVVMARINDSAPLPFIVDTGSTAPLVLDKVAIRHLKLAKNKTSITVRPGNLEFKGVDIKQFELCNDYGFGVIEFPLRNAFSGNLSKVRNSIPGLRIAGIIGAPMLGYTSIQFDFGARTLRIQGMPARTSDPNCEAIPLIEKHGEYFVKVGVEGAPDHEVLIDTGSSSTGLLPAWIPQQARIESTRSVHESFGAAYLSDKIVVSNLTIGKMTFPQTTVTCEGRQSEAALGLAVLSRCRFTIDFHNGYLLIDNQRTVRPALKQGWTGIELLERADRFVIGSIQPSSPAAHCGLKIGDSVVKIDGFPIRGLLYPAVKVLLDGTAGTRAKLEVRRKGKSLTATVTREPMNHDERDWLDGTLIQKPNNGSAEIVYVTSDSPADQAGLKTGDVIQQINRRRTDSITPAQLLDQLKPDHLELTIYRNKTACRIVIDKNHTR